MHTMRRTLRLWIVLLALLLGPAQALASPFNQSATYTVEEGDTWMSIAFRFGVPVEDVWVGNGVANPDLLAPGQRLFIPGASLREDTAGSIIELAPGTGFLEVAANSDTMLVTLQTINHAQWPYLAENQAIYIPDAILHLPPPPAYIVDSSSISAQDLQATLAPPVASVPQVVEPLAPHIGRDSSLPPLRQSRLGVQGNFLGPNQKPLLDRIGQNLGVGWVKQQVLWKVIEPDKGVYQEEELERLDSFVEDAHGRGVNILLGVVAAPDWARPSSVNHGPPTDYNDLADFMGFLAGRYQGSVQAYEVWNEPNLQREWTDFPMSGTAYANMLSVTYPAIKAADPGAIVVSAGLAPAADVQTPDGTVLAVDDRQYLRDMYAAGLPNYTDVIGIHPYSAGNAPDASVYGNPGGAPSHNNHESFFFRDNINAYLVIQNEYGDSRSLWATEFGWPSSHNIDVAVPPDFGFMVYITEEDQADFTFRALLMAQEWDYMGPMFVYILNFGEDRVPDDPQRAFALIDIDGRARPVYEIIRDAPRL
jgi:LysM repeat protein